MLNDVDMQLSCQNFGEGLNVGHEIGHFSA